MWELFQLLGEISFSIMGIGSDFGRFHGAKLVDAFPPSFVMLGDENALSSYYMEKLSCTIVWIPVFSGNLHDEEIDNWGFNVLFGQILGPSNGQFGLIWIPARNEKFLVKSFHDQLLGGGENGIFPFIWKADTPSKSSCFHAGSIFA